MPPVASPASVVHKARRVWPWVLGGIVGLLLIIGIATTGTKSVRPDAAPDQKLAAALSGLLGDSNRNIPRISQAKVGNDGTVEVHWAINDNLTPGLIKDSARQDVVNIVTCVKHTVHDPQQLIIVGDFAMPDGDGHAVERPVVDATYSAHTLAKLSPAAIRSDHILQAADSARVDPAFQ